MPELRGRLQVVAGEHAQASGVDRAATREGRTRGRCRRRASARPDARGSTSPRARGGPFARREPLDLCSDLGARRERLVRRGREERDRIAAGGGEGLLVDPAQELADLRGREGQEVGGEVGECAADVGRRGMVFKVEMVAIGVDGGGQGSASRPASRVAARSRAASPSVSCPGRAASASCPTSSRACSDGPPARARARPGSGSRPASRARRTRAGSAPTPGRARRCRRPRSASAARAPSCSGAALPPGGDRLVVVRPGVDDAVLGVIREARGRSLGRRRTRTGARASPGRRASRAGGRPPG